MPVQPMSEATRSPSSARVEISQRGHRGSVVPNASRIPGSNDETAIRPSWGRRAPASAAAHRVDGRLLELDVHEERRRQRRQDLAEARNAEARELLRGEIAGRLGPALDAIERGVMEHDGLAVQGQPHVQLHAVAPGSGCGRLKCSDGVLRRRPMVPAMSQEQRPRTFARDETHRYVWRAEDRDRERERRPLALVRDRPRSGRRGPGRRSGRSTTRGRFRRRERGPGPPCRSARRSGVAQLGECRCRGLPRSSRLPRRRAVRGL